MADLWPYEPHSRVSEYDGAFRCIDCLAQWGALPGEPVMPSVCDVEALLRARRQRAESAQPESMSVGQLNQAVRDLREALYQKRIKGQGMEEAARVADRALRLCRDNAFVRKFPHDDQTWAAVNEAIDKLATALPDEVQRG